jgi:hypothetical protein
VADINDSCRLVLWEEDVDKIVLGKSYQIMSATVKSPCYGRKGERFLDFALKKSYKTTNN